MSDIAKELRNLIRTTKALRAENGCPWDKKQTFETLRTYVIEEAYEVVEAIDSEDILNLKEEVGDLLLQVLFLSNIAEEKNLFNLSHVLVTLNDKLIRRHPHVFGDRKAQDEEEALSIWNEQKSKENKNKSHEFSKSAPSLIRAIDISKSYSKSGLDFPSEESILLKLASEIKEFREASLSKDVASIEDELGDILFTVANICRIKKVNPEIALNNSSDKFNERAKIFLRLKSEGAKDEDAWDKAKLILKERSK